MFRLASTPGSSLSPAESTFLLDTPTRDPTETLSRQHMRLLLYLLPFAEEPPQLETWLRRPPILAAWTEFTTALAGPHPDPCLSAINPKVRAALGSDNLPEARFCMLHPDKRDWSAGDHHVRFIVAVISDTMLEEQWDRGEDKNGLPNGIVRAVYEILVFLKAMGGPERLGNMVSTTM